MLKSLPFMVTEGSDVDEVNPFLASDHIMHKVADWKEHE